MSIIVEENPKVFLRNKTKGIEATCKFQLRCTKCSCMKLSPLPTVVEIIFSQMFYAELFLRRICFLKQKYKSLPYSLRKTQSKMSFLNIAADYFIQVSSATGEEADHISISRGTLYIICMTLWQHG